MKLINAIKTDFLVKMFDETFIETSYKTLKTIGYFRFHKNQEKKDKEKEKSFISSNNNKSLKKEKETIEHLNILLEIGRDPRLDSVKIIFLENHLRKKKRSMGVMSNPTNSVNIRNKSEVNSNLDAKVEIEVEVDPLLVSLLEKIENDKKKKDEEEAFHLKLSKDIISYVESVMYDKFLDIVLNNRRIFSEYFHKHPQQLKYTKLQEKLLDYFEKNKNHTSGFEDKSNKDTKIYFKQNKEGLSTILFEKTIKCELMNFLKLIYNTDFYKLWFPFVKTSATVVNVNVGQKIVYLENELPLISNRDFLIYGFGINRMKEENKVLVLSKSIDD